MRFITVALSTGAVVLSQQGCKKTTTAIPVVSSKTNVTEPVHVTVLNTIQREEADKKEAEEQKKKAEEEEKKKAEGEEKRKSEEKLAAEKDKKDHKEKMAKVVDEIPKGVDELHKAVHKRNFAPVLRQLKPNKHADLMDELLKINPVFQGEPKALEESKRIYHFIAENGTKRIQQLQKAIDAIEQDVRLNLVAMKVELNKLSSKIAAEPKLANAENNARIAALEAAIKAAEAKLEAPVIPKYHKMVKEAHRLFKDEEAMHKKKADLEKKIADGRGKLDHGRGNLDMVKDFRAATDEIIKIQAEMAELKSEFEKLFFSQTM